MTLRKWLITGGIAAIVLIVGYVFLFWYTTRSTIKEITGEHYLPDIFNQPLHTKTDMVMFEFPPHSFIKEPLYITNEFDPSDSIYLKIPVGSPLMFTKAYSRYSAVSGFTTYVFVGTLEVDGKSYPVEWPWHKEDSVQNVFEKTNP